MDIDGVLVSVELVVPIEEIDGWVAGLDETYALRDEDDARHYARELVEDAMWHANRMLRADRRLTLDYSVQGAMTY
jgi:hypothetical protein